MTRALAFIALRLLALGLAVVSPLAPILCLGPLYLCELGMDRLRPKALPPAPDRSTDLRIIYWEAS